MSTLRNCKLALAGQRKADGKVWEWLDGKPWDYQNWKSGQPPSGRLDTCLWTRKDGAWSSGGCNTFRPICAVCANLPTRRSGNHTLTAKKDSLINPTFHFWWNHTRDSMDSGTQGFKLSWHIESGSFPDVCKQGSFRQCVNTWI